MQHPNLKFLDASSCRPNFHPSCWLHISSRVNAFEEQSMCSRISCPLDKALSCRACWLWQHKLWRFDSSLIRMSLFNTSICIIRRVGSSLSSLICCVDSSSCALLSHRYCCNSRLNKHYLGAPELVFFLAKIELNGLISVWVWRLAAPVEKLMSWLSWMCSHFQKKYLSWYVSLLDNYGYTITQHTINYNM